MTTNINIVDRVVERLKTQPIGDLITDDDLYDIVKEAIPKVFFEERKSGSGYNQTILRPLIYEAMEEALAVHVKASVDRWAVENAQTILDTWQKVFDAGIIKYVNMIQDTKATDQVRASLRGLVETLNQERMQNGLNQLFI